MSKFNPAEHLIDLRGKKYLPVNMRLVWFREDHPKGSIQTEVMNYAPIVMQARIYSGDGVLLATGHGTANANGKQAVWTGREIEKAETAAIGRALGHAGFETQFDNEDDDLENLADSPIELVGKNASETHLEASASDLPQAAGDYQARPPQVALNGNSAPPKGQKKRMATEPPKVGETRNFQTTSVTVKMKDGQPRYALNATDNAVIWAYSRDVFRAMGYSENVIEDWGAKEQTIKFTQKMPLSAEWKLYQNGEGGGYWAAIFNATEKQIVQSSEIAF